MLNCNDIILFKCSQRAEKKRLKICKMPRKGHLYHVTDPHINVGNIYLLSVPPGNSVVEENSGKSHYKNMTSTQWYHSKRITTAQQTQNINRYEINKGSDNKTFNKTHVVPIIFNLQLFIKLERENEFKIISRKMSK